MNFLKDNLHKTINNRKDYKIKKRQNSQRHHSPYINMKQRPQTGTLINKFKIKNTLPKNANKLFDTQNKENTKLRCTTGFQKLSKEHKQTDVISDQTQNMKNGSNLHKYLYIKKNELQNKYNEIEQNNKKIQTRIQQITIQREKLYQHAKSIRLQTCSVRTKNLSKFQNQKDLELIFCLSNPEELKQKIYQKKLDFETLQNEYENLCIITKGDNRLYLQNQSVFNNKILLTQIQKLRNIFQVKDKKIFKDQNKIIQLKQMKIVQDLLVKELQQEQLKLENKLGKQSQDSKKLNLDHKKVKHKSQKISKNQNLKKRLIKENALLTSKIKQLQKRLKKQKRKQQKQQQTIDKYFNLLSFDYGQLFKSFLHNNICIDQFQNVDTNSKNCIENLQKQFQMDNSQIDNLIFLFQNGESIEKIQTKFKKYKTKYVNLFLDEYQLIDDIQEMLEYIGQNNIIGKNKIQLFLKKQHNFQDFQINMIMKALCDKFTQNNEIVLNEQILKEMQINFQSEYSDNNSIQFHNFDQTIQKKESQNKESKNKLSQNSIQKPQKKKANSNLSDLKNKEGLLKDKIEHQKYALSCTFETKTKEISKQVDIKKDLKSNNFRKIKISHKSNQLNTKIKKLNEQKANTTDLYKTIQYKDQNEKFDNLNKVISRKLLSQGFYCIYEVFLQKILDSYIDQVQTETLNQLILQ